MVTEVVVVVVTKVVVVVQVVVKGSGVALVFLVGVLG